MEAEPEAGGEHNGLLGLRGAPKEHLLTVGYGGGIPCTAKPQTEAGRWPHAGGGRRPARAMGGPSTRSRTGNVV